MTNWSESLFAPRRVALVGASETPGKVGFTVMQNMISPKSGFSGEVIAIHPKLPAVCDKKAYPRLTDAPREVDLAVVVAPPTEAPRILEDCGVAGIPAAIVISGGFSEVGLEGARLQSRLLSAARASGVRLIGPNCFGVVSTASGLNASIGMGMPKRGGVALFTQSGAYGMAALTRSEEDHIGFSRIVACGNKADVDEAEMLRVLGDDNETSVIAMLVESIGDGRRFFEVAQSVGAKKPIVMLKTGQGKAGGRAATSHTAALSNDTKITGAALKQAGVHVVEDGQTLLDVASALDRQPRLVGKRVGIITNSGGVGVELSDLAEARGMEIPCLSDGLQASIRELIPTYGSPLNPIDVTTDWRRFPEMYGGSVKLLLESKEVDAVVPVLLQRSAMMPEVVERIVFEVNAARARGVDKPVHVCWVAPAAASENRHRLLDAGIPCHDWPIRTASVLAATIRNDAHTEDGVTRRMKRPAGVDDSGWVASDLAFQLLAEAGLPVAPWTVAKTREEAAIAAAQFGTPVVLKAERKGVVHKSDDGGVRLGIENADEAGIAYETFVRRFGSREAIVQKQMAAGVEIFVGARRDVCFGPVILCGLGGVWVEALGDIAIRLAPIGVAEARSMLHELKGRSLLSGARGRPNIDLESLSHVLAQISRWFAGATWLEELDLNPVIGNECGLFIVDARMRATPLLEPTNKAIQLVEE